MDWLLGKYNDVDFNFLCDYGEKKTKSKFTESISRGEYSIYRALQMVPIFKLKIAFSFSFLIKFYG